MSGTGLGRLVPPNPIDLRTPYAMSVLRNVQYCAIVLRARYAMSGTELAYAATRPSLTSRASLLGS
eukprot:3618078-Rhodomonas_salina.8